MDRFSFFFAFYGLILGLAVTELLGGFARFVRARQVSKIDIQTALLALFTFVAICATWIDAWLTFRSITLDFAGLWAPILIATCYYLAATVIFPTNPSDYDDLAVYFAERKRFVVGMMFAAEILVTVTFLSVFQRNLIQNPAAFWLYLLPYNLLIKGNFLALLLVKSRRANITCLCLLILLFLIPYWGSGVLSNMVVHRFGHLWST